MVTKTLVIKVQDNEIDDLKNKLQGTNVQMEALEGETAGLSDELGKVRERVKGGW